MIDKILGVEMLAASAAAIWAAAIAGGVLAAAAGAVLATMCAGCAAFFLAR